MVDLFDSLTCETVLRTFVQYLITFCIRPEAASDVIYGSVVRPNVKFRDRGLNRSHEIRSDAVRGGIVNSYRT